MTAARSRGAGPRTWKALEAVAMAACCALAAWLLLGIIAAALTQNLLFDGAMNLEVSRSLAEGNGPRRLYDTGDLFPAGVQTKEPYLLLGALVFRVLGVGPVQAQLPNLVYLFAFLAVLSWLVARLAGGLAAALSVVLVLALPWMSQYALNGYGEIPSLAFGLASLAVVSWPGLMQRRTWAKCVAAGVLAGLALATKTVGLVQLGGVGLVLLLRIAFESPAPARDLPRLVGSFAAGCLLPLAAVELWRLWWLGPLGFRDWWGFQFSRILYQAGLSPASGGEVSLVAKAATHFGLLQREMSLGRTATASMLLVPLMAALSTHFQQRRASTWLVVGLASIAVVYIAWWLCVTPTEKAWLRRLYVGLACLAALSAVSVGIALRDLARPAPNRARVIPILILGGIVATYMLPVARAAKTPMTFEPSPEVAHVEEAANRVAGLPQDARLLAYGWYAAPTVALQSGRNFMDLTDWPIGDLVGQPSYVVADRASFSTGILDPVLARYPHTPLLPENIDAQVYRVDFSSPRDPFHPGQYASASAEAAFSAADRYEATYGMEPFDPTMGGRWIGTDAEILLRYTGGERMSMRAYMALPQYYRFDRPLAGRLVIEGCGGIPFAFDGAGWQEFDLPLPCTPAEGSVLRVRILLFNVFDLPRLFDRQRGMLLQRLGFA